MTELDELLALRPAYAQALREAETLRQELSAERATCDDLRKAIVALRNAARNDRTPAMGNTPVEGESHG